MKLNKQVGLWLGMVVAISALAYLPLINKLGYFNDDWYLMYGVRTQGAQFFHALFSSDRPGRAFLMIPLYSWFGLNPLPYNLTAYLFRVLGGVSLFWILRMLWPQKNFLNATTAILFTIYPGFLSQHNAIDYQSHILALFLALLSVALSLASFQAGQRMARSALLIGAILLGWGYLSQIEFFIGIEAFRAACIFLLVWRSSNLKLYEKLRSALFVWLPFTAIPVLFLIWRVFYFDSTRRATDVGFQLGQVLASPLTGLRWLTYLIQDFFNVTVVAWGLPLTLFVFPMRLQNLLIGLGLAGLAVVLFVLGNRWSAEAASSFSEAPATTMLEELWVGFISIVGGLAPVIAANRHIVFPDYSRYSMIASIGALILLVACLERLATHRLRITLASLFIAIAVMVQYGNTVKAASETEFVKDFWWQVAWRAPQIKAGTTLAVSYSDAAIQEDYFIWGPANHIYYPDARHTNPVTVDLSAVVLNKESATRIAAGLGENSFYRRGDVLIVNDFNNVLVLTQSDGNACMRILDGHAPELSVLDEERVMLVAPSSKIEDIVVTGTAPIPPAAIFGNEPAHDWCYYYQKAALARQQGDWQKVAQLGNEAQKLGLHPNDQIEWMPFLQAYAILGDQKQVKGISTRINTEPYYRYQACKDFDTLTKAGNSLSPAMQTSISELFCK